MLKIFELKNFRGGPTKIYLHEHLIHEYFYARKFPDLRYACELHARMSYACMCVSTYACTHVLYLISI